MPGSAKELIRALRAILVVASNAGKIVTPPGTIFKQMKLVIDISGQLLSDLRERDLHRGAFCITGGEKNQKRDDGLPHFKRNDGAWFDFTITGLERNGAIEVVAYDFEIRCAPGMGSSFLRFDLNLPDHRNQERDLRCHLHAGSDDVLVPAPLMSPMEMMTLFVDGIRPPTDRGRRAPTAHDVRWLQQTLEGATRKGD